MKSSSTLQLVFVSTLTAVLGVSSVVAADFVNGGFETGSFDGWTQSGGHWSGGTNYPANYIYSNAPYQSAIVGPADPADVPCLTSRTVSVSQVRSGLFAARINSNDFFTNGMGYRHFSQIQQTVSGWDSPYFSFDWSAVLQDSWHSRAQRPHFRVILQNLTTGTTNYNIAYYSDNLPPAMVQSTGTNASDWLYTDWQHVQLNTPDMTNHTLLLTVLASDCSEAGHDGALYVDNIMGTPITGFALPVAVPAVGPNRAPLGTPVMLDGSGSYDSDSLPIDTYDWDFNGDGVTDLSGGATNRIWTIPTTWAPGTYTLNLRVREQLPSPPAPVSYQWSPWTPVTLTVLGPPVAARSTLTPAQSAILADGQHTQVLTVQARDAADNILTTGGTNVLISLLSGTGTITSTTDNGNGTYTAKVKSPPTPGSGTFIATMGGIPVGTAVEAAQSVVTYFLPPNLSATLTPTNTVVVWWPLSETAWRLQATTNLPATASDWTELSYQTDSATCRRIEAPSAGNRFYRLTWP